MEGEEPRKAAGYRHAQISSAVGSGGDVISLTRKGRGEGGGRIIFDVCTLLLKINLVEY